MTVYIKEIRQSFKSFCIWSGVIAFMVILCVAMFPQMKGQMDEVSDMFANMGGFTAAFGMDRVNYGEIMGFYGIECGNMLAIGGSFFAAFIGISILSKEEKEKTAEFLLTHPISRSRVLTEKLLAIATEITALNGIVLLAGAISFIAIGESIPAKQFLFLHLAYFFMQVEIACICFGISAFLSGGSIGIGLGLAAVLYFMNIIRNISSQGKFLKYITPFAYAEATDIVTDSEIRWNLVFIGLLITLIGIGVAFLKYGKKDISA